MSTDDSLPNGKLAELTAQVIAAYVNNNSLPPDELPKLIREVSASFSEPKQAALASPQNRLPAVTKQQTITGAALPAPAINVRRSVSEDYLICLICGQRHRMLKRHLMTAHGITPQLYRTHYGLPDSYPLAAPSYTKARSEMAKRIGLGRGGYGRPPIPPTPPVATAPAVEPQPQTEDEKVRATLKRGKPVRGTL